MTEQQQELYEKLLKKVNEFCLGQAAEDVIEAIDNLVDTYETTKVDPAVNKESISLQALEKMYNVFRKDVWYETVYSKQYEIVKKSLKALEIIKDLFDFDFALRFPTNQPMLKITNKQTKKYWEIPISKEYELLKEVLK